MKDTLLYILSNLVENKEAISVEEKEDQGRIIFVIRAEQTDIGRIIGKHGRIIRAIRDLIKVMAMKQNQYVDITIAEEQH